jgi:hypothetical protein
MLKLAGELLEGQLADHIAKLDAHGYSFMQKLRTGEYFRPEPTHGLGIQTLLADRIYARPFIVPRNLTIDRLAIEVTEAATDKIARLGIYEDGTDLYPGALVKDYGTISVADTGVIAASGDQSLTWGLYWLVIVSDGTPKVRAYRPGYPILGQQSTGFYVGTQQNDAWFKNAVGSGALADPFVSGATIWQQYAIAILPRLKSLD